MLVLHDADIVAHAFATPLFAVVAQRACTIETGSWKGSIRVISSMQACLQSACMLAIKARWRERALLSMRGGIPAGEELPRALREDVLDRYTYHTKISRDSTAAYGLFKAAAGILGPASLLASAAWLSFGTASFTVGAFSWVDMLK